MINLSYKELPNSMVGLLIVEDPNNPESKQEFYLPKFIINLVRSEIQAGTLDLGSLWSRTINLQKALP